MSSPLIVFEDAGWQRLLPLVYVRAAFQLICGAGSLLDKITRRADARAPLAHESLRVACWCRPDLRELVAEQVGLPVNPPAEPGALLLNGRGLWHALPTNEDADGAWVGTAGADADLACIGVDPELAARLAPEVLLDEARCRAALAGLPRRDVSACVTLFRWPWEIVLRNARQIEADWERFVRGAHEIQGVVAAGSYLLNPSDIHIGRGSRIKPCVVIDAEEGPVWIGENVTILPHVYVQGPAVIGDGTLLQPGAVVHEGTTIGPRCKVGGEVEASIIQGFSNKQHDGFLGHSYVGCWVNIAADCINSDLKNTYGLVKVPINGREVDTGEMFVGMLVGDYSKAGINVSFPTGAVIGFCSSVFAPQSPKFVPSFAWIEGDTTERYDEQRGLAIARKVMARRKRQMTAAEERVFLAVRRKALAIEHQPQVKLEIRSAGST